MAKSVLTLDLKAHTSRALGEFKSFSDNLEKKFFVSGLKLDVLRNTLGEINREFDKAMGSEGMRSAMELKQLETSSAAVFSALKGGSLDAGREMAKNIRIALGDVSKSIGSTTEDINSVMRMIPYTSKELLDTAGVSMEEFHTMNLEMVTNARDAMGEDAAKLIEGLLSGSVSNTDLLNDRTGIGQMIRQQVGPFDPSAMSPEARTEKVLQILQNQEFQSTLNELAEDNAGFMRVVRQFKNTLFDQRTGVFGVLKESTLSLREFSGERVSQVTSIFKETTRLFTVLFDVNTGLFATIFKTIGEVFGFNSDNVTAIIIRMIRWVTNVLKTFTNFFDGPIFRGFLEGLKGIVNFFVQGFRAMTGALGTTPGGAINAVGDFFTGFGEFIVALSSGNFAEAAQVAIAGVKTGTEGIVTGLESISESIASSGIGEDGFGLGGVAFGATIGTMIAPGLGTVIGGVIGGLLGNELVVEIVRGTKDIVLALVDVGLTSVSTLVQNAGGWDVIADQTVKFIEDIGLIVLEFVKGIGEQMADPKLDLKGLLEAGTKILGALVAQVLTIANSILDGAIDLKQSMGTEPFEAIGRALGKLVKALVPLLIKGTGFVLDILEDILTGFFSEFTAPISDSLGWLLDKVGLGIQKALSGLARLFGLEDLAQWIDTTGEGLRESMVEGIEDFLPRMLAKLTLIFNPGGIVTKVLGKIPVLGKIFSTIYRLLTFDASLFKGAGRPILRVVNGIFKQIGNIFINLGTVIYGALTRNMTGAISRVSSGLAKGARAAVAKILGKIPIIGGLIDFAMNMGQGDSAGRAGVRAGTGVAGSMALGAAGAALGTAILPGIGTVVLGTGGAIVGGMIGNDGIGKNIADFMGLKHSGNIPEYARAANGLNMLDSAIQLERENTRPGITPVIANSDEIIIPPGRLNEVSLVVTKQVENIFSDLTQTKKAPEQKSIILETGQLQNSIKQFLSASKEERSNPQFIQATLPPGLEALISKSNKNLVDSLLKPETPNNNNTLTSIRSPLLVKEEVDSINKVFSTIEEDSESIWQKSTDTASEFFRDFSYKAGTEWKAAVSKPIQIEAPTVQVDTSAVTKSVEEGFSGLNFGEIMSKVPEGMSEGWGNVVKFFEDAGKKAGELMKESNKTVWNFFEDPIGFITGKKKPDDTSDSGKSPEKFAMGLNLNNFVSSAQSELLNSGYNNDIVIANSSEIVAPKSSLVQLADLLTRDRIANANSNASIYNTNTFSIEVKGSGQNPEVVANLVIERIDEIFSQQLVNNRVPYA